MAEHIKVKSTTTPNPAKSINPPSLPTKTSRGDGKTTPRDLPRGNGK